MAQAAKMRITTLEDYKARIRNTKPEQPPTDRALTVREVGGKVGVSRGTIYRWIKEGSFPNGKRFGKSSVRWLESTIDAWMTSTKENL